MGKLTFSGRGNSHGHSLRPTFPMRAGRSSGGHHFSTMSASALRQSRRWQQSAPLKLFRIRSTEDPELGDEGWNEVVQRASKARIHWSAAQRAFVAQPPMDK